MEQFNDSKIMETYDEFLVRTGMSDNDTSLDLYIFQCMSGLLPPAGTMLQH